MCYKGNTPHRLNKIINEYNARKLFKILEIMKKIFLIIIIISTFSCSDDVNIENDSATTKDFVFEKSRIIENYETPLKDIEYLQALGFSGSSGIVLEKTDLVRDEVYISYLMEGDIEIRKDELESMVKNMSNDNFDKQYRTTNLVNSPRTIRIIGVNMYNNSLKQGLTMAVQNYNDLSIGLTFTLEFRTVQSIFQAIQVINDSDIRVGQSGGSAGGISGFPTSNGMPYPSITVSTATSPFGLDVVEHVFTHEIGHTIGLRHTDFFNRSISCGSGGNEGAGTVGAIHIPGTPQMTNIDLNSIMLSCFNGLETGEFSNFDITALNFLY